MLQQAKHVPVAEYNLLKLKTNVIGTQNVVDAALDRGVETYCTKHR